MYHDNYDFNKMYEDLEKELKPIDDYLKEFLEELKKDLVDFDKIDQIIKK